MDGHQGNNIYKRSAAQPAGSLGKWIFTKVTDVTIWLWRGLEIVCLTVRPFWLTDSCLHSTRPSDKQALAECWYLSKNQSAFYDHLIIQPWVWAFLSGAWNYFLSEHLLFFKMPACSIGHKIIKTFHKTTFDWPSIIPDEMVTCLKILSFMLHQTES
jgi:hypothetical protein